MKAINPNMYPKGGYQYKDPDGSVFAADSWAGVIKRVEAYRKRQGKPTDTAHDDVITQACQKNPVLCSEKNLANEAQLRHTSLKSRVLQWLGRVRAVREKSPLTFVSDALHAARCDVCRRCSKNTGMPEGCGSCRVALKALAEDCIGRREISGIVTACIMTGEYLPVATWIDVPTIPNPELPGECWRKRTL